MNTRTRLLCATTMILALFTMALALATPCRASDTHNDPTRTVERGPVVCGPVYCTQHKMVRWTGRLIRVEDKVRHSPVESRTGTGIPDWGRWRFVSGRFIYGETP